MKNLLQWTAVVWAVLSVAVMAPDAGAHGPTPQKVEEKVTIAAPPDAVWKLVSDFGQVAEWHPGVAKCSADGSNGAGATREITLKNGKAVTESIDELNEAEKQVAYRLGKENLEALPVSFYSATLRVKSAEGGGSDVEWVGRFYRGDTSNFPPENLNDEAAVKAMTEFFRQGLEGLKAKLEAKG